MSGIEQYNREEWRSRLSTRLSDDEPRHQSAIAPDPDYTLPSIWNIPFRRNNNFTGRATLLADLATTLRSGQPTALTQAITGLGGIGKTQLAVEYAYRHAADYDVVWWVRAEEPATLLADLAGLAQAVGLAETTAREYPVIVAAVRHWLERHARWLLIFDNARDRDDLRDYLPRSQAGHLLITSRFPSWRGVARSVEIPVLTETEAVAFLVTRSGQTDTATAKRLAHELGYLPLALEQAGAYIEETGQTLAGYLALFQTQRNKLLKAGLRTLDYPDSVATTWSLSFDRVRQAEATAADLLTLLAFFAPDAIPLDIIRDGVEFLPADLAAIVARPLALDEIITLIREYSLVTRSGDSLSIHRLVQAVLRDRLTAEATQTWATAAVHIVNQAFPDDSDDVRTWSVCARLLPHALTTTEPSERQGLATDATGRLLNQVGLYSKGRADYTAAKNAYERALRIDEAAYGPDHPSVAIRVNNLGDLLHNLGELAGARTHYERALRIDEAAYGPDHPTVAIDVNNLGSVLQALGELAGAQTHYERALRIDEAAYGPDHPTVARDVNNLGSVLQALGELAGARTHFERALRIFRAVLGEGHPSTQTVARNLAGVVRAMDGEKT